MQPEQTPTSPRINHVIAPDHLVGGMSAPESGQTPEKKKSRKGLAIGIVASLSGAAIAAGAVMGVNAMNGAPTTSPTAEAVADPSEPITPDVEVSGKNEPLPSELQLEISAGLSVDEVGATIIDRFDSWNNAGTNNQQVLDEWYAYSGETRDYVAELSNQYADQFADALYVEDWQTPGLHPDLVNNWEVATAINAYALELNLITSSPDNGDIEPYRQSDTFEAVREVSSDGDTRVIAIDFVESNNADQNRVGEDFGTEDDAVINVPNLTYIVTLVTVDGTERIAGIDLEGR